MTKQKLLYIGHSYHNKTKSTQFLKDMLAEQYEVETFDFDPYKDDIHTHFAPLQGKNYDVVVIFQIMPRISELKKVINFKKSVFFPMYDGAASRSDHIWLEYKNTQIINFCKTLHEELENIGLSSHYIQYFPKPLTIKDMGKTDSVFFWQRITQINFDLVTNLLDKTKISHLHFHKAIDPSQQMTLPKAKYKVTTSEWFETREQMQAKMQESALYIAPRHVEGIGMSFLEAMAMGRLVIALNNPTMNEYIKDGQTGYLYDLSSPRALDIKRIRTIQKNALQYIEDGYAQWEKEKFQILDWLQAEIKIDEKKLKQRFCEQVEISTYKLFSFIPILKSKRTSCSLKFYLFGFLPLISIKKK